MSNEYSATVVSMHSRRRPIAPSVDAAGGGGYSPHTPAMISGGGGGNGGGPPDGDTVQKLADLNADLTGLRREMKPVKDLHEQPTSPLAAVAIAGCGLVAGADV